MELLEKNPDLDSIICSTEYASVGAIEACVELGINIGKDISLITYDGPVVESLTNPKITAVAHPLEELGKKAIEILMNQDKNTDNISYLAVPHIIERGSVRSLIKSN
jgi:LacI family transcriptional regulator